MLLPDPPQLHGTFNHLEQYSVAERLGVIAASDDEYALPGQTLLRLLLDDSEFYTAAYASLFDRTDVKTRDYGRRLTVKAGMTSAGNLSVRISTRRYAGYGDSLDKKRSEPTFAHENKRPSNELLSFPGARDLTKDLSEALRVRVRNDDLDEIRRLHARVIVLRFWKAVLRLAFHFDVTVESYPVAATNGPSRGSALNVIDAVDAHRQQTEIRFKAFEKTTGYSPDRVWEVCGSHRSTGGHLYREEAAEFLNRSDGGLLRPPEIETAFDLLRTAVRFGIYKPATNLSDFPLLKKRPELRPRPRSRSRPFQPRLAHPPKEPRIFPIEPALAEELGVTSTTDLVAKLNNIWKSRGEPPLPQGSYPTNKQRLASVVRLYRGELNAGVA
ncbi:hypothetical protein QA649_23790 [Bradyrhizobium sp. CB1717]|uniref:hypothetical protein n=1 Tax=Bradyrhizobium sp. CB1717 TaxID=3039154 RepID=UPI0024B2495C|nr:hypothetical protein [Bradyrhizobium sp. CB1717]WFU21140.1 hypothetical protein QA649_23790 [Bradyrhizobium sp. CB1717]